MIQMYIVTRGRITSQAASATANENEDMKMSFVEVGGIIVPSIERLKFHARTYQDYLALENFKTIRATKLKRKEVMMYLVLRVTSSRNTRHSSTIK